MLLFPAVDHCIFSASNGATVTSLQGVNGHASLFR